MIKSLRLALLSAALMTTPAFAQEQTPTPVADAPVAADQPAAATAPTPDAAVQPAEAPPAAPEATAVAAAAPTAVVVLSDDGKVPAPPTGKGQVVFFRPARLVGAALTYSVRENNDAVAKVGNGHYFVVVTDPGSHAYQMKGEVTDTLNLEVDAGETYYVETGIGVGIVAARPNLTPSSEEAFEKISKKLKPSKPLKQES